MTWPILRERRLELGILGRIFLGELRDLLRALFGVVVKNQRAAVGRERSHRHFGRDHVQAMLLQLHVADDVGTQRPGRVCQRGAAEAGMKFFGDGRAARLSAALQHQRLVSGFGQIESGDQSVMAATDDDDVAVRHVGFSGMR